MGDSDVQAVRDLYLQSSMFNNIFHLSTFHNQVFFTDIKHSDYTLGPAYTKEFSLVGKNNVAEKVRVMEKPGLFSKDLKVAYTNICWRYLGIFGDTHSRQISQISQIAPKYLVTLTHSRQVSKCGESGCKEESLAVEEERQVSSQNILKSQKLSERKHFQSA